jgi:predicted transcriptional regulator
MDEVTDRKFVSVELDEDLFLRLQAVVPRVARRLQLPLKRARSTVIRLALAQYLEGVEDEQKPAA